MTPEERNALIKTLVVVVAGVVNTIIFGFDFVAIGLFLLAPVIFLTSYLPARRRRS